MKLLLALFLLIGSLDLTQGQDHKQFLPEPDNVGDWATIEKQFKQWKIAEYTSFSGVADGGSVAFSFVTDSGLKFDILVANPHWWNEADVKDNIQAIYILINGDNGGPEKAYRVEHRSAEETRLLQILSEAATNLKGVDRANPYFIKALIEVIKSRKPPKDKSWLIPKDAFDKNPHTSQSGPRD